MNSAVRKTSAMLVGAAMQVRRSWHLRYISAPPLVRISTAERLVHVAVIAGAIFAGPAWFLLNLQDYKKKEDKED